MRWFRGFHSKPQGSAPPSSRKLDPQAAQNIEQLNQLKRQLQLAQRAVEKQEGQAHVLQELEMIRIGLEDVAGYNEIASNAGLPAPKSVAERIAELGNKLKEVIRRSGLGTI